MAASCCAACKESLGVRGGAKSSSVPLYKHTTRKKIIGEGGPVQIVSLLEEIGISVTQSRLKEKSLSKKCTRKISNCHKKYFEIVNGLNNGAETSSCCVAD